MRSSLDDEYSVTCVATKVAWYIPCVIWSRGGASVRSDGGCKVWVIGWMYGRGFYGYGFSERHLTGLFEWNFAESGKWV